MPLGSQGTEPLAQDRKVVRLGRDLSSDDYGGLQHLLNALLRMEEDGIVVGGSARASRVAVR